MADFVVGVTGGVASGKSEVTRRFEALDVAVIDADVASRSALAPGSDGLAEVVATFGRAVLDASGALDRAAMRRRVFADADARMALERIVHPRVRATMRVEAQAVPGVYAVVAIPLLAEGGGRITYPWLRRILVVDVAVADQHARLLLRDGIDATLAEQMISVQATRAQRLAMADDVIVNSGSLDGLDAQVASLDRLYRSLACPSGQRHE